MSNLLFQFVWSILKPPKKQHGTIEDDAAWMLRQFQVCGWFGGPQLVILGDSNAASMQPFARARFWRRRTVNIGKSGATFVTWWRFLTTTSGGAAIRNRIGSLPVLINLGGNHCWTPQAMLGWEAAAEGIRTLFPGSWIFNIPPVAKDFLTSIHPDAPKNIDTLNRGIARLWRSRVLDVHSVFASVDWAYSVLAADIKSGDPVHYSERADIARIKMANDIPWGIP